MPFDMSSIMAPQNALQFKRVPELLLEHGVKGLKCPHLIGNSRIDSIGSTGRPSFNKKSRETPLHSRCGTFLFVAVELVIPTWQGTRILVNRVH